MRHGLRILLTCVAATIAIAGFMPTQPAVAATVGTGKWYWPTGSEDFGGMGPWWQSRGGDTRHLAQDMAAASGRPVYAVGAGTVLESKHVSGYGPGGSSGGAVVILHKTATGREFKALYGHLKDLRYQEGDTVAAGAVIGLVNGSSPNHVHFGIHPGSAYPSDNNPFRGHTYNSDVTYGWVDPVAFLRNNPRLIAYVAPKVPVVLSQTTTTTPIGPVAAGGEVWWSENSDETTTTWVYSIAQKTLAWAAAETTPPAHESRFVITVDEAKPGLTVSDLRPRVSATLGHTTPAYGTAARIKGRLTNAAGLPFQGASVSLQRWSGSEWTKIAAGVSGADGRYEVACWPSNSARLRVRFSPKANYTVSASATLTVTPHVKLTRPALSVSSPRRGVAFRLMSTLAPRHATSARVIYHVERKVNGSWVRVATKAARLRDVSGGSRASVTVTCSKRGAWRARAYMPADSKHAATKSRWVYFDVR